MREAQPEFAEAIDCARALRQRFFEGPPIDAARRSGDITRYSTTRFALAASGSNDWGEKGPDLTVNVSLASPAQVASIEGAASHSTGAESGQGGTIAAFSGAEA